MFTDITIGQYYPANSILHRLDPRVKLFGTLVFVISLFMVNSFVGYILITICLATIILMSDVPIKSLFRGLRGIILLLMISVLFTLFFTEGQPVISFWIITITRRGIKKAAFLGIRLIYLVVCTSIMTLTTTPSDLSDGLEKAFAPLSKVGFPVHEIAMMMSIALRFIPIFMEETDKIMKAQKARGAEFDTGGLIKKAKSLVPLLVPLFISAIRRALDLALAMEARCYRGGEGRTKMKPLKYKRADAISYALYVVYFAMIIGLNIFAANMDILKIFMVEN
ncbi:MAG: energy-coupling factor transporter transmembrane component T family protein [Eubacterium sp.]